MGTWLQLLFLAAIWGSSHVLVRVAAPVFGPERVAWARIFIAAIVMLSYLKYINQRLQLRKNLLVFGVVGLLNCAIPFLMFARAAMKLPASYLAVLNSTTPIFSAILGIFMLKDEFTLKKAFGLALGISGVALVEEYGVVSFQESSMLFALSEGLLAGACYALAGIYIKKKVSGISSEVLTAGSFLLASLFLFPFLAVPLMSNSLAIEWGTLETQKAILFIIILGVVCSAFAFVLYYRLIEKLGPFRSTLVTFVVPIFGMIWGVIFLDEKIYPGMMVGAAMIIGSTALFMRVEPKKLPSEGRHPS